MTLADAYALLKTGTLWAADGRCKGYAVSNPAEAAKVDAYVAALAAGTATVPPTLATATGRGLVGMLAALAPAATPPPPPPPGDPVPPPPTSSFGGLLPTRIMQSAGGVFYIAPGGDDTNGNGSLDRPWRSPIKALTASPLGSMIRARGGEYDTRGDHALTRVGSPTAITTLMSAPGERAVFNGGRFSLNGAAYFRFASFDKISAEATVSDNFKLQAGAHHLDFDDLLVADAARQGFLVGSGSSAKCMDIQILNSRLISNGTDTALDHGAYFANAGRFLAANLLVVGNAGYGLQLYPDCDDGIVTCSTIHGHPTKGAIALGGQDPKVVSRCRIVGVIATKNLMAVNAHPPNDASRVEDCLSQDGAFEADPQIAYARLKKGVDPLYVTAGTDFHLRAGSPAIGMIDPVNHGYLPPLDIDGKTRITATAGCYAA